MGLSYDVFGVSVVQFCNNNGNGLYFNYKNTFYNNVINKKEEVKLTNIHIHPKVSNIIFRYNLLNKAEKKTAYTLINYNQAELVLYDTQELIFEYDIKNIGDYDIQSAKLFIYGYKKDEYKVTLDEIDINKMLLKEYNKANEELNCIFIRSNDLNYFFIYYNY